MFVQEEERRQNQLAFLRSEVKRRFNQEKILVFLLLQHLLR